jgi:integrase/recombinase XerC
MAALIIRTIRPGWGMAGDPWLARFQQHLLHQDLAENTIRGYLADLRYFGQWLTEWHGQPVDLARVTEADIRAYRQHLVNTRRQKPATVNRRLQALRRLYAWATHAGLIARHPAQAVRFRRKPPPAQPPALTKSEVHALLRVAGQSPHGLARRNYALVQLMLQAGLRVSEVVRLQLRDLDLHERSGTVTLVEGKGHKDREVPLNATARRALLAYFETRREHVPTDPVFRSKRETPMSVRALQKIIAGLAARAKLQRLAVTAHTLRHTFAHNYLQANPGHLVELAMLLGHESLDTTAIYTKASRESLAAAVERSELNVYD